MKLYLLLSLYAVTLHCNKDIRLKSGKVESGITVCSGVFISPNTILTANHCVEHTKKQWIKTSDNKSYRVFVAKIDRVNDLALLYINQKVKDYAKIGNEPYITDKVYTVNSGHEIALTYSEGIIENIAFFDEEDTVPVILDNILISPGASGSGLFNKKGQLIGINTAITPVGSIAVNTPEIKKFLQ